MKRPFPCAAKWRMGCSSGFFLVELVATILVLSIVTVIVIAGLTAYTGVGRERDVTRDAQLAQQRLELVLAYKLKNGFPQPDTECRGPDPCDPCFTEEPELDACGNSVQTEFSAFDKSDGVIDTDRCVDFDENEEFAYCDVEVRVDGGPAFALRLYSY